MAHHGENRVTLTRTEMGLKSELPPDRLAQVESVLRIIRDTTEKLKMSLILPRIFENPVTVECALHNTPYTHCLKGMRDYIKERRHNKDAPALDFQLTKVIDCFHENHKMIPLLPNWLEELTMDERDLMSALEMLYQLTEQRLHKSALTELLKEKQVHKTYHDNEHVKKNIQEFQTHLRNQRINLRWKMAAKDGVIMKYEEDLAFKKWDNNVKIKQEIAKTSRRIRNINSTSLAKQKELEEELEKTKATYEKVLKQNLKQEREARAEKNKLLLQLQGLIKKFDQTIGDKIKENMSLQEQLEEQKREFDIFMIDYLRDEYEYETVVHQRELEEKRRHEERIMLFMMNRAARILQRWWRKLRRERRKSGKGKKKGKKK